MKQTVCLKRKRGGTWLLCAALLLSLLSPLSFSAQAETVIPDYDAYYTVGSLQQENQVSRAVLAGSGLARVSVNLPASLDVSQCDPANLMLTYALRVTRDDGISGSDSLVKVVNGWTKLFTADGSECFSELYPVQSGVPADRRIAGTWMPVSLSLKSLTGSGKIGKLEVADYNDFPKQDPPVHTGITYEVRHARIVDTSRGADGTPLADYITTLKGQVSALLEQPFPTDAPSRLTVAYQAAKTAVAQILSDNGATVNEVSAALTALQRAQIATDKSVLQAAVNEPIDRTLYTQETLALYDAACSWAQTLLRDTASCGEVADALQALRQAMEGLTITVVPDIVYGDLNNDTQVTVIDALIALQAAANQITLEKPLAIAADVDGSGDVRASDALKILQAATNRIADVAPALSAAINAAPLTFCNPLNLNYMYSVDYGTGNSYKSREAADPAVVIFKGEYYLFASHNEGYWVSSDLADWEFIRLDMKEFPQFQKFAPATCVVDDTLYVTFSEGGQMMKTTNPRDPHAWEDIGRSDNWVDPAMYYDDPADGGDGYVYLYSGLSDYNPIDVRKLDPRNNMAKVGDTVALFRSDKENHGFEVPGNDHTNYNAEPYLEGAWMNKYNGKYYLTYAVPGTGDASYCDGCYVADSPMGPFRFCENSPVVWKASGYAVGAGHGCLFEDLNGNWWKVDTVSIMTTGWERRLAIFPATFDEDGDLFTNTVFGDYPAYIPTQSENPFTTTGPGWNLLSYGKTATASSSMKDARYAFDESIRSWWSAESGDPGEWLQVDLGKWYPVWAVQVNFADQDIDATVYGRDNDFHYEYRLEFSQDGQHWYPLADRTENTRDMPHDYIEFTKAVTARYIRITNTGAIPANGKMAISGLRVFGEGEGIAPAVVSQVTVNRYAENERSASISWPAVKSAQGYIVRFGTKPGALYNHYQVIGDSFVTLNCLNKGVDYYFRVDAYNESGLTIGTTVIKAAWTQKPVQSQDITPGVLQPVEQREEFPVYEAEDAAFGNTEEITGAPVGAYDDAGASGGKTLHNLEHAGAYFAFSNVDGGQGGDATLLIGYANGNNASRTEIFVNRVSIGMCDLPGTGGWTTFKMLAIPLSNLTAGATNTIRFEGGQSGYNPDWIQIIY